LPAIQYGEGHVEDVEDVGIVEIVEDVEIVEIVGIVEIVRNSLARSRDGRLLFSNRNGRFEIENLAILAP